MKKLSGFTLIELMVVVAIAGMAMAFAIPAMGTVLVISILMSAATTNDSAADTVSIPAASIRTLPVAEGSNRPKYTRRSAA